MSWIRWNNSTGVLERSDDSGSTWNPAELKLGANAIINKTRPEFQFLHSGNVKSHIGQYSAACLHITNNLSFDGTNWNLDDTSGDGTVIASQGIDTSWWFCSAGANPRTITRLMAMASGVFLLDYGQIKFPSIQNPSSDVNTLDDYEEGSFIPTWAPTGSGSISATNNAGYYVKIGRLCFVHGYAVLNGSSPVGMLSVGGFPFTCANDTYSSFDGWPNSTNAAITAIRGQMTAYTSYAVFYDTNGNIINWANKIGGATDFRFSGCYMTIQ